MKKSSFILIFVFLFFIFSQNFNQTPKVTFAKIEQYARITKDNTYFYHQPVDTVSSAKFILEKTYFVLLLEKEKNGFHKALFDQEEGYVRAQDITYVVGTPNQPFPPKRSFRVFSLSGLNIRSAPSQSQESNTLDTIPFLENNIIFYGIMPGEEMIKYKGNIWYYCWYNKGDRTIKGYVYSAFCDLLTPVSPNIEQLETTNTPIFEESLPTGGGNYDAITSLPKLTQILVISGVSLPCIVIIYLLFKPTKISIDNGKKKKKIRKLRNSDYYEFED